MLIDIAERLKPFSLLPGTACILPGSNYQLEIFPALLRVYDLSTPSLVCKSEIDFVLQGPLHGFTIQNDLEKGVIRVWGKTSVALCSYRLHSCLDSGDVCLHIDKVPADGIVVLHENKRIHLQSKDSFSLLKGELMGEVEFFRPHVLERLSLGNHKAQDVELIRRRLDLTEIFPIWHRLGQLVKPEPAYCNQSEGTLSLMQVCKEAMEKSKPEHLVEVWTHLFLAGFKSLFAPHLQDEYYQGLVPKQENPTFTLSPLVILTQAVKLIRSLFFQYEASHIKLLPLLPPEFACGRLMGIQIPEGTLAMEWTKKAIRRVELQVNPQQDAELVFHFRHAKQCRLRKNKGGQGQLIFSGKSIFLEKNCCYFFDNFQ